jgi:hypothetical protein
LGYSLLPRPVPGSSVPEEFAVLGDARGHLPEQVDD